MYHFLTVEYRVFNPFKRWHGLPGAWEIRKESFVLNWDGVKKIVHDDFYRDGGYCKFTLASYHGQPTNN